MLPYLHEDTPFPDVAEAFDEPNGLLAAGGDLSCQRLICAYQKGIFPWYSEGEPILWWSPDPRTVFMIDQFKPSRSLRKLLRKSLYTVTLNQDFESVIKACAQPRPSQMETWISAQMIDAYCQLSKNGVAHSVEVWDSENRLVGGIYGVHVGHVFCGESMFSRVSNGSKIALASLIGLLKEHDFKLLDCQLENPHLVSLGAVNIARDHYLAILSGGLKETKNFISWHPRKLDPLSYWA